MKKRFELEDLDCANCAAKLEAALQKIKGVQSAGVNFITQKLTLEAADEDFEAVLQEAVKVTKKTLPDVVIRL